LEGITTAYRQPALVNDTLTYLVNRSLTYPNREAGVTRVGKKGKKSKKGKKGKKK
jgi:hypothetical protein